MMAIRKDLRSHQYLDDWLARARSHQACLQHTQELVNNVSATRLVGEPKQDFNFVGYQFDLRSDRVRLTPDGGRTFKRKC